MNPYPAKVSAFMTIIEDKDLVEAVRSCGGDELAALVEERLLGDVVGRDKMAELKSILSDLNSAIANAESAADDLSALILKEV